MNNPLNLKGLLLGDLNRLRYLQRYGTSLVMHHENVAEHSYYVALYARYLCRWVETNELLKWNGTPKHPVNTLAVLERALVHDADESRTGDFQRPFKYSSVELKEVLDVAAKNEAIIALSEPLPDDFEFRTYLMGRWDNAKDDSLEGAIVALADFMCVVSYLWNESEVARVSMVSHFTCLQEYVKTFDAPKFIPLMPIIDDLREIVDIISKKGIVE